MNNNNIVVKFKNGILYGQYTTRDPKDQDDDGTPVFKAQTPAESINDRYAHKRLKTQLCLAYDNWVHNEKYKANN